MATPGLRIIIAEDDPVIAHVLLTTLEQAGHRVTLVQNGREAFALLLQETFEVLVTDFLMAEMDGIQLIRRVRAEIQPSPAIIMCTIISDPQTREYALSSGADGFQAKPFTRKEIAELVTNLGLMRVQNYAPARPPQMAGKAPITRISPPPLVAVAIAASTGGPDALKVFFSACPAGSNVAYFVTMHGPDWVQHSCVSRLQAEITSLKFMVAEDGTLVRPGRVYYAPGDRHMLVSSTGAFIQLSDGPAENYVRPAADPLFRSVAGAFGSASVAVVLTGLGCDGAAGAHEIARVGGRVFCQDPITAVAPSMPESTIRAVKETEVLPLAGLARAVCRHVGILNGGDQE